MLPYLDGYDKVEIAFLQQGFANGFRIGTNVPVRPLNDVKNPKMSTELDLIFDEKLKKELDLGRIAGPFDHPPLENFRCSPVRLEPKSKPGEYRRIHNLSHRHRSHESVNSSIPDENKTVQYQTVDDAIAAIQIVGPTAYLAKTDIKSAFRIIPIHPSDYHLLGFKWRGKYYYDKTLPMGAGSACQIFERFSNAIHYIAENKLNIAYMAHILDDFLLIISGKLDCSKALSGFINYCDKVGIPIAYEKTAGPAQILEFLGITLNVPESYSALPHEKVVRCSQLLHDASTREKMTLKDLQILLGHLNFACRVVVPGRTFLGALYACTKHVQQQHFYVRLSALAKQDIQIWKAFLTSFNGRSFFQTTTVNSHPSINLHTDAAKNLGFGACLNNKWIMSHWEGAWKDKDILVKEAYAVLVAIATWGDYLRDKHLIMHIDNEPVVKIFQRLATTCEKAIPLVRILFILGLKYNISFEPEHIPGVDNVSSDALSRF